MDNKDCLFESMISRLDIGLFNEILSQTGDDDKKSLLAVQSAVRGIKKSYVYLEIGSHLGGSIQPYLLDHRCSRIYSIDKRPEVQPDERFLEGCLYPDNSTKRMLSGLKRLSEDIQKITCFDNDASEVDKNKIELKPDICLIDGEHTNKKVISDFNFCRSVLNEDGIIIFHDAGVVKRGLREIIGCLKKNKENFKSANLKSSIFVLFFGHSADVLKVLKSVNVIKTLGF